jgi:2Fe-2S ferredoxin
MMPKVIFIFADGEQRTECSAESGDTLLTVAHENDIDIEGACEGSMACSTCHIVVGADWFNKLPQASEFEEDMLDLTYGVKPTSRLGCQIEVTEELDGLEVSLPDQTVNMSM